MQTVVHVVDSTVSRAPYGHRVLQSSDGSSASRLRVTLSWTGRGNLKDLHRIVQPALLTDIAGYLNSLNLEFQGRD